MKKRFSNENGVTMLTVTLTVIVLIVILSVVTFYVRNSVHMEQFQNMKADIREIESKALTYYVENGVLPVYSGEADSRKTRDEMAGNSEFFNPNDGDEYAKVNLSLLGIIPAYDTDYYINMESFTVYANNVISLNSKEYPRPAEEFDNISLNSSSIPEWEKECYESTDVISKMFEYNSDGVVTGIDTEYCASNLNPEYYSDPDKWTKLVIPAVQPSGEPVTGIAQTAFDNIEINGTLKIPSTVQSLPDGCLGGKNIRYLYCDAASMSITAFVGCNTLEEVHLGPHSSIPDGGRAESTGLFRRLTNLKKVWIDCTSIGSYAFADCSNMQLIVINNDLKEISDYAFYDCLNKQITILTDIMVTDIDDTSYWPVEGTYVAGSINFPDKLEKIGGYAFYNDKGLAGAIDFTKCTALTKIGESAFFETNIASVKINPEVNYENKTFPQNATISN